MLLFAICSKTTDDVGNGIGNGLDYAFVGVAEDNETVQHVVAPMPTSNEIQSGGEKLSNEQSSSSLNDTDDPSSFVVVSGKFF
jgi:hypothetical protein